MGQRGFSVGDFASGDVVPIWDVIEYAERASVENNIYTASSNIISSFKTDENFLYFIESSQVVKLDPASKEVIWKISLISNYYGIGNDGSLYVYQTGNMLRKYTSDGVMVWERNIDLYGLNVSDDIIIARTNSPYVNSTISKLDNNNGDIVWSYSATNYQPSRFVGCSKKYNVVLFEHTPYSESDEGSTIRWVNATTGALIRNTLRTSGDWLRGASLISEEYVVFYFATGSGLSQGEIRCAELSNGATAIILGSNTVKNVATKGNIFIELGTDASNVTFTYCDFASTQIGGNTIYPIASTPTGNRTSGVASFVVSYGHRCIFIKDKLYYLAFDNKMINSMRMVKKIR